MAKPTKPAQKGGAKKCAPKKAAKKPAKKLTERQADQRAAEAIVQARIASTTEGGAKATEAIVATPAAKPSFWHRFRSAITGLFVSKKHAEANPHTTVRERVKP